MNRSEFALVKNFACYKPFKGKLPLKCLSDYLFTNINNNAVTMMVPTMTMMTTIMMIGASPVKRPL